MAPWGLFALVAAMGAANGEPHACFDVKLTKEVISYDTSENSAVSSSGWIRSTVSDQDDGCFQGVVPPFNFPWQVNNFESLVSISPNGALHFGASPEQCCNPPFSTTPCQFCYFATPGTCTLNNRYRSAIAGFLTDLNPSTGGDVYYAVGSDALVVRYDEVPFFFEQASPTAVSPNTFQISIFPSGNIRVRLENVTDPRTVCCWTGSHTSVNELRTWSVGVRLDDLGDSRSFSLTKYQADWNTSAVGYYPNPAEITSGITIDFERMKIQMCSYPQYIDTVMTNLTLVMATPCALCTSCAYEAQLGSSQKVSCDWVNTRRYLRCTFTFAAYTEGTQLQVQIIEDNETLDMDPVYVYVTNTSDVRVTHSSSTTEAQLLSSLCSLCANSTSLDCPFDCNGDAGGLAAIDSCGKCSGGSSGLITNQDADCAGICDGAFKSVNVSSVSTCICDSDLSTCSNYTSGLVGYPSGSTSNLQSVCISPNATRTDGGVKVFISTGSISICPETTCNVTCAFGNVEVIGEYSSYNQSVQCTVPPAPQVSTEAYVRVILKHANVEIQHGLLIFEYIGENSTRYNSTSPEQFDSEFSRCFDCASFHPIFCRKDCTDTYHGTAVVDECSRCTGGSTNLTYNQDADCAGICDGPFQNLSMSGGGTECYCSGSIDYCTDASRKSIYQARTNVQQTCISPLVMLQSGGGSSYLVRIGTESNICPSGPSCSVMCQFGSVKVQGFFINSANYVECEAPAFVPSAGNATVLVKVLVDNSILNSPPVYLTYLEDSNPLLSNIANQSTVVALCDRCNGITNGTCYRDCNGTWMGSAQIDDCGACAGGDTGRVANIDVDCQGVCFGPFETVSGYCVCRHVSGRNRESCVESGSQSVYTTQSQETLCANPFLLPTSQPTEVKVFGKELLRGEPSTPTTVRVGRESTASPAAYDSSSNILTFTAPAINDDCTTAAQVQASGSAVGPWLFLSFGSYSADTSTCGQCTTFAESTCQTDCNGVEGGSAYLDDCGTCVEGNTGKIKNEDKDCQGICFGPFLSNGSGVCACPEEFSHICQHYERSDGDTEKTEIFVQLDGYYVFLVVIVSIFTGGILFWLGWVYMSGEDPSSLQGLPCIERLVDWSRHRYAQLLT